MNRTLYILTGRYVSTLSLVPRAFVVEASRNINKSLVNLMKRDNRSLDLPSNQNIPIRITEPVSEASIQPLSILPLNRKGGFVSEELDRKEKVIVYSEVEKNINKLENENVSHQEYVTKYFLNDNPGGKPTDTENSGTIEVKSTDAKTPVVLTTAVKKEPNNDTHKIVEIITQDIDQEEDFFNDYADGEKADPKRDEYSPYVQRLLLYEREKPHIKASKIENISPYDKPSSIEVIKVLDDLAKLLGSSNNVARKLTGTVYEKGWACHYEREKPHIKASKIENISPYDKPSSIEVIKVLDDLAKLLGSSNNVARKLTGTVYEKALVNLKARDKASLDQETSNQKVPIQITEPVSKASSLSTVPLNSKGDFVSEESQREEKVGVCSEVEKHLGILIKEKVSHQEDVAKDYFSDNPGGKPIDTKTSGTIEVKSTDTKSSRTTTVDEEQKNYPHKILEVATQENDQEEHFSNDYLDGKKYDPKIKYKKMLRDKFSPYVRRLLFQERVKSHNMALKIDNMSRYDKTNKPPSTGINKTFDDLAKLYMESSNNVTQKSTRPVYGNSYSKDLNNRPVQAIVNNHTKLPMGNELPTETNRTFGELAKRFLKSTNKNHLQKVGPVIINIKNIFKNQHSQPAQPNVLNLRKISNNPIGLSRHGKSRNPSSKTKKLMNEIYLNNQFDEIAKRCLKSPDNEIDQIILEELAKPKHRHNTRLKKKGKS